MSLTKEEVKKLAQMVRIEISDVDIERFQSGLSTILDYIEELKSVNTDGIVELSTVTGLQNVQRADKPVESPIVPAILANAPETKDGYYKVKSIL